MGNEAGTPMQRLVSAYMDAVSHLIDDKRPWVIAALTAQFIVLTALLSIGFGWL